MVNEDREFLPTFEDRVSADELRHLTRLKSWRAALAIVSDWLVIFLAWGAVLYFENIWVYLPAFLIIARQQLALAILMHDGSHRRLFNNVRINDGITQWFLAAPLLFSVFSYQKNHLIHHRDPLAPGDPDLPLIGGYPISKMSFARKILRDAVGISYFKFIRYFLYMSRKSAGPAGRRGKLPTGALPVWSVFVSIVVMQALIFSFFVVIGYPLFYLLFWILPAVTALQVLLRIRGIAEHAGYAPNPDQRWNARTVCPSFQTLVFAPHNVHYHIEHHVYPSVPFYNLPKLHRLFAERGLHPRQNVFAGYGAVLKDLVS